MPLSTHSGSRKRWNHRSRLIFSGGFLVRITLLLLRVQYAPGRWFVRTIHPDRIINTMINMFRKCCQPSQAGNPTGAAADRWDSPGKSVMNDCTAGSRRNHWAMSTRASRSMSATGMIQASLNHLFFVIGDAFLDVDLIKPAFQGIKYMANTVVHQRNPLCSLVK